MNLQHLFTFVFAAISLNVVAQGIMEYFKVDALAKIVGGTVILLLIAYFDLKGLE